MKIIILGDVLLDINYYCNTTRLAPEANIPVYNTLNIQYILGGASNVAKNMAAFGCDVEIISVIGDDSNGSRIKTMLEECKIKPKLYIDNKRKTTQKNRIFNNDILVTRYDIEDTDYINSEFENKIIEYVKTQNGIDAIIFSDYAKGVLTKRICETIIEYSNENKILTFVDPKTIDAIKYKGCFCFKSNLLEGQIITGNKNVCDIFAEMMQKFDCKHAILTCGENGMYVNSHNNHIYHKSKVPVLDVTGCGDVVLSVLTYCYLKTKDIIYSSKVANYVAGKCVGVIGNYVCRRSDLNEFVDVVINDDEPEKINLIRNTDKKVVFTNGCFDVIHSAHIRLLQFAKKQGDILVVGLNTDESIKRFKGDSRPINNIEERCELLKNLGFIDYIIIFKDDTPKKILSLLKPNVLIKGGDYTKESIIGKEYADEIIIYNYIDGLSSTNVIKKIKNIQ
jgi:D-beta-D-heptose 7-phosphate kinase/D-beta-D-heptose 1-phosphate adenosyltransferase